MRVSPARKALPLIAFSLSIAGLLLSCAGEAPRPFDPKGGIISKNYQPDQGSLAPIEVEVDSEYDFYYTLDHLVFISESGQPEKAVTAHLGRGLRDNKYNRAERDFFGFYYNGASLASLAYTKMRHDSTRLETSYPYYTFGGLAWDDPYRSGTFSYDRRNLKFEVSFSGLTPVQYFADRDWRLRVNAFGDARLVVEGDTVSGLLFYELIQLEGYNPIDQVNEGINYVNYDWIALRTVSGRQLLISTDSSTVNDLLMRNFVSFDSGDVIWYADGTDNVDMISEDLLRDRKIYEWLANKKRVNVPGLGLTVDLNLTDTRVFYTNGYAIAVVEGTLRLTDDEESVWGILEHRQQPGTTSEALR